MSSSQTMTGRGWRNLVAARIVKVCASSLALSHASLIAEGMGDVGGNQLQPLLSVCPTHDTKKIYVHDEAFVSMMAEIDQMKELDRLSGNFPDKRVHILNTVYNSENDNSVNSMWTILNAVVKKTLPLDTRAHWTGNKLLQRLKKNVEIKSGAADKFTAKPIDDIEDIEGAKNNPLLRTLYRSTRHMFPERTMPECVPIISIYNYAYFRDVESPQGNISKSMTFLMRTDLAPLTSLQEERNVARALASSLATSTVYAFSDDGQTHAERDEIAEYHFQLGQVAMNPRRIAGMWIDNNGLLQSSTLLPGQRVWKADQIEARNTRTVKQHNLETKDNLVDSIREKEDDGLMKLWEAPIILDAEMVIVYFLMQRSLLHNWNNNGNGLEGFKEEVLDATHLKAFKKYMKAKNNYFALLGPCWNKKSGQCCETQGGDCCDKEACCDKESGECCDKEDKDCCAKKSCCDTPGGDCCATAQCCDTAGASCCDPEKANCCGKKEPAEESSEEIDGVESAAINPKTCVADPEYADAIDFVWRTQGAIALSSLMKMIYRYTQKVLKVEAAKEGAYMPKRLQHEITMTLGEGMSNSVPLMLRQHLVDAAQTIADNQFGKFRHGGEPEKRTCGTSMARFMKWFGGSIVSTTGRLLKTVAITTAVAAPAVAYVAVNHVLGMQLDAGLCPEEAWTLRAQGAAAAVTAVAEPLAYFAASSFACTFGTLWMVDGLKALKRKKECAKMQKPNRAELFVRMNPLTLDGVM